MSNVNVAAVGWASCSLIALLLLRSLASQTSQEFSLLAQLLLLHLLLITGCRNPKRLQPNPRHATLNAVWRVAKLYVTLRALSHFGPLFAFLLQQLGALSPQLQQWRSNGNSLLLMGYLLLAGVSAAEFGALLHTIMLLGATLGLEMTAESATFKALHSDSSPLTAAVATLLAMLLAFIVPDSAGYAQKFAVERTSADLSIFSSSIWTLHLLAAALGMFAAGQLEKKIKTFPPSTQAKAQLICSSTGMGLAVLVTVSERGWLAAVFNTMACACILWVLVDQWWGFNRSHRYGESYLDTYRSSSTSKWDGGVIVFRVLWAQRHSRKMLIFLGINVVFMFVELAVGLCTNSLGLMGDAGHMLFDNGALVIGLVASYIGQLPPDSTYTYGYGRVEVLSGFLNSLLLLVVSFHLLAEAASRFIAPPEIATDHLLLTSVAGLIVNLVGLFFFHDHVGGHSHSHSGHLLGECGHSHGDRQTHGEDAIENGHNQGNSNLYGVYLHVLADTLGSVGVIVSSVLIELFEWHVADSISSTLISLLIVGSTLPLLRDTARQLLQGAPHGLENTVNAALQEIQTSVPGLERIAKWNIWHQAGDMCIATLHLEVAPSANEQQVLQHTKSIFRCHGQLDKFLSVQISKPQVLASMSHEHFVSVQSTVMNNCNANENYSHNHAVKPALEVRTVPPQRLYTQFQQMKMSTHENPASEESRYFARVDVKIHHFSNRNHERV